MNAPHKYPFARQPAGVAPLRRPGSVRRTTSVDSAWPDGAGEPWIMTGRARDIMAPPRRRRLIAIKPGAIPAGLSPRRLTRHRVACAHQRIDDARIQA